MVSFDYSVVKHYKFYGFVKKVFGPIFRAVYKLSFTVSKMCRRIKMCAISWQ